MKNLKRILGTTISIENTDLKNTTTKAKINIYSRIPITTITLLSTISTIQLSKKTTLNV